MRQVLVNVAFGRNVVPSGTLTSKTKLARSGPVLGVGVLVGPVVVVVAVGVAGVPLFVGVGVKLLPPVTTISTHQGLSPCAPRPKRAPPAFCSIQKPL